MPVQNANIIIRKDLTDYSHGITQDHAEMLEIAKLIAPVVPTGGDSGAYNIFEDTQAFAVYAEHMARRGIGAHATEIPLLSSTGTYLCENYGLRIKKDEGEIRRAGGNELLLDESKTRQLTTSCMLAYLGSVISTVKAAVSVTSGKGVWNDANVDPIDEVDQLIKNIFIDTGLVPNTVLFDFGAWAVMKGNKNVLKRMPGADIAAVTPERIGGLFVNPSARVMINKTSQLVGGGLGNTAATRKGILGGSVLVFFSSEMPTNVDPSFCKTFSPSEQLFTGIREYRDEPHFTVFEIDWAADVKVISSKLCARIDVTNANTKA